MEASSHRPWKRLAAAGLTAMVVAAALAVIVHSSWTKQLVARWAIGALTKRLGGTITVDLVDYRLWRGEARLAAGQWVSADQSMTASVGTLEVQFGLYGISSIVVRSPRIRLSPSSGSEPSAEPSFSTLPGWLLAAELRIEGGTLSYQDAASPQTMLTVDGIGVELDNGTGTVSSARGTVERSSTSVALGPLSAAFQLGVSGFEAERVRLEVGGSSVVTGSGGLTRWSPLAAEATLTHSVALDAFEAFLPGGAESEIAGTVTGESRWVFGDGRWRGEGSVASTDLTADSTSVAVDIPYRVDSERLVVEAGKFEALSGHAQLDFTWDFAQNSQRGRAVVDGLRVPSPLASRVHGSVFGSVDGWDFDTADGGAELELREERNDDGVPLSGAVRFSFEDGQIRADARDLQAPGVRMDVFGDVGESISLQFEARVADLGALTSDPLPASMSVEGSAVATGTVNGTIDSPLLNATFSTASAAVQSIPLDASGALFYDGARVEIEELNLRQDSTGGALHAVGSYDSATRVVSINGTGGDFVLDGAVADLKARVGDVDVRIEGPIEAATGSASATLTGLSYRDIPFEDTTVELEARGGRIGFRGAIASEQELLSGSVETRARYPASVRLRLDALPVEALVRTFPTLESAELAIGGELIAEGELQALDEIGYRVDARSLAGVYRGIGLEASSGFVVEGDRYALDVQGLTLVGDDTAIDVEGELPLATGGVFDLAVRGNSRLELLHALVPDARLTGPVDLDLEVVGTAPVPSIRGTVSVTDAELGIERFKVDHVDVGLRFDESIATIKTLRGNGLGGSFELEGEWPLTTDDGARGRLRFRVDAIDPTTLLESEGGNAIEQMAISGTGELSGAGLDTGAWSGSGTIDTLRFQAGTATVAQESQASWSFTDNVLALSELRLTGGSTDMSIDGSIEPFADPVRFRVRASGAIDPAGLSPLLASYGVSFTGTTRLDIDAFAGELPLDINGTLSVRDGRLSVREPAISFTSLSATVDLNEDAFTLAELTADAGGGSVRASGRVLLAEGLPTELDLEAAADGVRLSYPEGLRSQLDGSLRWHGPFEAPRLTGTLTLDRAIFSRDVSLESELLQSLSRVQPQAAPDSLSSRTRIDIQVRTREGLRIDNNLARMEASANLRVAGSVAEPSLIGTVTARQGGEFRFGRNRYRLESGRITLNGYPAEPPALDISARTSVAEADITLRVSGTTDDLTTALTGVRRSDQSEISRGDAASLLVTGRTLDRVSTEGRTILGEQMASYVGASLGDLAQLGLGDVLPFRLITVEPDLVTGEADPSARFTLGAGLTETLSVVYSVGLDDPEKQIWIVDYQMPYRSRSQLIRQVDNEFTAAVSQRLQLGRYERDDAQASAKLSIERVGFYFISGEPAAFRDEAHDRFGVRESEDYDYWDSWNKAEALRNWLRNDGFLDATVDLKATPCGSGCIEVDAFVATGKRILFQWTGDDIEDDVDDALLAAWDGYLTPAFLASELGSVAERELFRRKFYTARVDIHIEDQIQETVVSVEADTGPKGKRVDLRFDGNRSVSSKRLMESLPSMDSARFHELTRSKPGRLVQLLELQYASLGFLEASVAEPERHYNAETRVLEVRIGITEGPRFTVEAVELEGVEGIEPSVVRNRLALEPGGPFRITEFVSDRAAIAALFRRRGFRDAEVVGSIIDGREPGTYRAKFVVHEGRQVVVGEIRVDGNRLTRERVVRRELALATGETLTTDDVNETQRRLYELGIFRSADVVVETPAGEDQIAQDVVIEVTEVPVATVDYGFRYTTDGLAEAVADVKTPNLFGTAQRAGFRTLIGSEQRIYRATYQTPYLFPFKIDTNFFVERIINRETPKQDEDFLPFTDRIWTFTFQQGRRLLPGLDVQWSYSFRRTVTELDPTEDDFLDPIFSVNRGIVTGALIGDFRDGVVDPTKGAFWSATFQGAPAALASELTFIKLFAQLYTFVPVGRGVVWASGYRAGAANSFGQRLVEDDRFQAGGANSVRGFEQGSLGPFDPILQRTLGGAGVLVFNQEVRFPIGWRIRGVGFYDAGNTFEQTSDMSLSDLRHSAGAGIRLSLPFGLLRLDWAKILDRREGEDSWKLVFSLGHAF